MCNACALGALSVFFALCGILGNVRLLEHPRRALLRDPWNVLETITRIGCVQANAHMLLLIARAWWVDQINSCTLLRWLNMQLAGNAPLANVDLEA